MAETLTLDQQLEQARQLRGQKKAEEPSTNKRAEPSFSHAARRFVRHPVKSTAEAGEAALQLGSARLLQIAWGWFIPSFGLTLLYIDMHALGRIFFPNIFCRLGDEWLPVKTKTARTAATPLMWFETAGVIALNMLALLILTIILSISVTVVYAVTSSWWAQSLLYVTNLWSKFF